MGEIYTDNAQQLGDRLSSDRGKTSALDRSQSEPTYKQAQQPSKEQGAMQEPVRGAAIENAPQLAEQRKNPVIDQGIGF